MPDVDGHDVEAVDAAHQCRPRRETARPTLDLLQDHDRQGRADQGGHPRGHGAPLGEKEIAATREAIGWHSPPFEVPREVYAAWDARASGAALETEWNKRFAQYRSAYPTEAAEFERRIRGGTEGPPEARRMRRWNPAASVG